MSSINVHIATLATFSGFTRISGAVSHMDFNANLIILTHLTITAYLCSYIYIALSNDQELNDGAKQLHVKEQGLAKHHHTMGV